MRKQIVGCRCRSSMCSVVRRTPQGVRRARSSLRTRMGFLDGSPLSRRKRKTYVGAPHVSPESCRVAQSEHLLGLRHDIRRLEVRAPIFGNPDVGSALLASRVKLFVARRRGSCLIGRSTSVQPRLDAREPDGTVPETRHETSDAGLARSTLLQAQQETAEAAGSQLTKCRKAFAVGAEAGSR